MLNRAILGGLVVLTVIACKNERPADSAAASDTTAAATPSANVVTFIARDYGFEGPGQIPAGVTLFRLDNQGKELHQMVIARLDSGRTYDSLLAALRKPGKEPSWMHLVGGPNAAVPGSSSNATHALAEGHYAVICFIPSADGVPHMAKGMTAPLEVVASSGPAAHEVAADVTITMKDYTFTLSAPITAGSRVIRVENAGPQPHELVLARFPPGKTLKDLEQWERGGEKGIPPLIPIGGIAPMMANESGQFTVEITPGEYTLICFVPDAKDGKLHLLHGMAKSITVG